jgi:hypothetical protein
MRTLMLAAITAGLSWVLLGPPAVAKEPVWQAKRVVVYDYTSSHYDGMVAQTVADFNAMLPKAAPRFIYQRMSATDCALIPWTQRGIIACSTAVASYDDGIPRAGLIRGTGGSHGSRHTRVELSHVGDAAWRQNAVCHELMHAVTGIPDNYGANPESCVWGDLSHPGPFDAAYAKRVYGKHRRH